MALAIAVTHTKTLINPSTGNGDRVYGADYVSASSHSGSITGQTNNALFFTDGSGTFSQDGTNLLYTTASGPRLQVGSGSGTSTGIIVGYEGLNSGFSAIWPTSVTPSNTNYGIRFSSGQTAIGAGSGNQNSIYFNIGNTTRAAVNPQGAAGNGLEITAGTATTDVAALSVTRTNNNAAVATGVKFAFTDTTSAAGFLPFQVLGGASAATNLFKVSKDGTTTAGNLASDGYVLASTNIQAGASGAINWSGRAALVSPADSIVKIMNNATNAGATLGLDEMTAPAGASNSARIFAQDNGGGKTQLMVIFGSGVAQQLAIEA